MIEIDGSTGESGGQILRTALSLAAITGKSFSIKNIRLKRPKPGLQAQHLTCVKAMSEICSAEVKGAELSSTSLTFKPSEINGGNYNFDIGTAGSITLLAQCVLPALLLADKPSSILFTGGTHVPFSPLADYFSEIFLPTIKNIGANAEFSVNRIGLYPKGGGKATLSIAHSEFSPLSLTKRGELKKLTLNSTVFSLPLAVAQRQVKEVRKKLSAFELKLVENIKEVQSVGQGTYTFIRADYDSTVAGFSSLGKIGKSSEEVGREAAEAFLEFEKSGACVDLHLADQLLIYAALAAGKSKSDFTTSQISQHFETNAWVIRQFLDVEIKWEKKGENYLAKVGRL